MKQVAVLLVVLGFATSSRIARADEETPSHDEAVAFTLTTLPVIASTAAVIASVSTDGLDSGTTRSKVIGWGALAGLAVGPSLGHWYAGEGYSTGLLLRGAGIAAAVGGLAIGQTGHDDPAIGLVLAGSAVFYTGVIWDVATVGSAVREHRQSTVSVTPLVGQATGLALAGTY